jgi:hypothetical protein
VQITPHIPISDIRAQLGRHVIASDDPGTTPRAASSSPGSTAGPPRSCASPGRGARGRSTCGCPTPSCRHDLLPGGKPFSLCALTIKDGGIAKMNFLTDPERLAALDFTMLGE